MVIMVRGTKVAYVSLCFLQESVWFLIVYVNSTLHQRPVFILRWASV